MSRPEKFSISSDEELMQHICAGEVMAFDELYARYGRRLQVYFVRMLNFNRAVAEDALQDLFLKIAEKPEMFDRRRSFRTWIFSVASNTCKNYYRHLQVRRDNHEILRSVAETHTDGFLSSAARMDQQQFLMMLDAELLTMSPEKREAFILRYQEEKTIAEIAEIQNCPEGSVKSRLHYLLRDLQEKLRIYNPS